jgi:hypothetical protein
MKEKKRIATGGEPIRWNSPFALLKNVALPSALEVQPGADRVRAMPAAQKSIVGGWISFGRPRTVAARP